MSGATSSASAIFAARAVVAVFLLPRFVSDFRAQQFAYVGIYFIACSASSCSPASRARSRSATGPSC